MCIHDEGLAGEVTIETGPKNRLLVGEWTNAAGRQLVTVTPQYQDRAGAWRLAHSGIMLLPSVARKLAPALVACADAVDHDGKPTNAE